MEVLSTAQTQQINGAELSNGEWATVCALSTSTFGSRALTMLVTGQQYPHYQMITQPLAFGVTAFASLWTGFQIYHTFFEQKSN